MEDYIDLTDELRSIRHDLHAIAERSFAEVETSDYLKRVLEAHGIEILHNPLETGVIARITGEQEGPRIALRADIDGLPVQEDTGLPYTSQHDGVMHACGHDIHMTSLLGAAFWLQEHRDRIAGEITLIFQPAEELGEGARALIDRGVLDGIDVVIGTHNNPNYAPGVIALGPEPMMAGCVKFEVNLEAQGTHAGYPHKGTGPIEAMASMILSLQTIVSRNATPFHPLVVSITQVQSGDVWNVVPARASFQGTVRYFHREDGDLAERRFKQIVQSTADAYGIEASVHWDDFEVPLQSDPQLIEGVALDAASYAKVAPIMPSMAGEDFAEYGGDARLVFAFIGSNGTPGCADWHSPQFVAFDESIETGANFYAHTALYVLEALRDQQ